MVDIVPELLDKIKYSFTDKLNRNQKVKSIQTKIDNSTATYVDAQSYSIAISELLAQSFKENITSDLLPDGKMYYNIAERILNDTLGNNHKLISDITLQIQESLNNRAGIGLKSVNVPVDTHRIKSMINKVSSADKYDDVMWMLNEPVVTFSQNIVDDILKANIEFQGKSGMKPTVTRVVHGHTPCDWCLGLAGKYIYPDVPTDVYHRHDRCKCTVSYDPGDNSKQDVWTKDWRTPEEIAKIEERKNYGL